MRTINRPPQRRRWLRPVRAWPRQSKGMGSGIGT